MDNYQDVFADLQRQLTRLQLRVEQLETHEAGSWVWLDAALTSTSWDGDARSTTAKTLIDLSAVFGVPDFAKAILARISVQDSGGSGADCWFLLSPNGTSGSGVAVRCAPANDRLTDGAAIVPCDASGDVYFQCAASGAGTLDVFLQVWGYEV